MSTSQYIPKWRSIENSLAGTNRRPNLYAIVPGIRKRSLCYCVKIGQHYYALHIRDQKLTKKFIMTLRCSKKSCFYTAKIILLNRDLASNQRLNFDKEDEIYNVNNWAIIDGYDQEHEGEICRTKKSFSLEKDVR